MPNIKLKDGSGIEQTYTGIDTITVPLADGTGTWTYGLTDEELTLTGDLPWYFLGGRFGDMLINKYGKRFKFNNISSCQYIFGGTTVDDLSYEINGNNLTLQAFLGSAKCTKLPIIKGTVNANSSNCQYPFKSGWQLVKDPLQIHNMINQIDWYNCTTWTFYEWFSSLYSLRGTGLPSNMCNLMKNWNGSSYPPYNSLYYNAYALDECLNIPVISPREVTSNMFTEFCKGCYRVKNIKFETNNGQPLTANWKNQTIDLSVSSSYSIGWRISSRYSIPSEYQNYNNFEFTISKNVCNTTASSGQAMIDEAQQRYNSLKNDNDWCSWAGESVTYDGGSRNLSLLFSRYNHASAVETINSLPDCSAYLATAGGTNTIKFKNYSGALTDGGGINDLTAAEIQVATDKGWTVTIVN